MGCDAIEFGDRLTFRGTYPSGKTNELPSCGKWFPHNSFQALTCLYHTGPSMRSLYTLLSTARFLFGLISTLKMEAICCSQTSGVSEL
jgi:hypothetical protein